MNALLQALQSLRAEPEVIRRSPFASGIDAGKECSHLIQTIEKLRRKADTVRIQPTRLDPQQVWTRWEEAGFKPSALDGLAFRTLCSSEETALRPRLVQEAARRPERLKNSRCLYGLVNVYFSYWRDMAQPASVEKAILAALTFHGRNSVVKTWKNGTWLFSERAAEQLADDIVTRQGSVGTVLREHHVGTGTKLALIARARAATRAAEQFRSSEGTGGNSEWALNYLRWMTEDVIGKITLDGAFFPAISTMILSKSAAGAESFQRALRAYIQSNPRLGDPRLRESAPHWRDMEPEARQLYLSWLARDSIIFFFNTILPDNNENRRRKDFWLRYHRKIKDFQVAVSENDAWKIRSNRNAAEMLYSRVTHQTASAFLMEFECRGKSYVVVEFSEVGNASYIYAKSDFVATGIDFRTARFDLTKHLKTSRRIARILHQGSWERSASYMLATELGLVP